MFIWSGDRPTLSMYLYVVKLFCYLVKSDLTSVRVYSSLHWAIYFLQGKSKTRPCLSGQVIYIVSFFL